MSLGESHARFEIGPTARRAWLKNMEAALEAAPLGEATRNTLREFFSHSSCYVIGEDSAEPDHDELAAPLHAAARRGNVHVARALLDLGAAVNALDRKGDTPLQRAINCRKNGVSQLLRERGAR